MARARSAFSSGRNQDGEFRAPADERREPALDRHLETRPPAAPAGDGEGAHGMGESLQLEHAGVVGEEVVRGPGACVDSLMRTPPAGAALCSRAARFTVSP